MNRLFLYGSGLLLGYLLVGCQPNTAPAPLTLATPPAGRAQLPPVDVLFSPFYATRQESATHRLVAITAFLRDNRQVDSSTLYFIYKGNQLTDKRVRPAGSATLTDLPHKLTFDSHNRLISSESLNTSVNSQTGVHGNAQTNYTYTGNDLTRAVRYTRQADGTVVPAVDISYTYLNGRYSSALIKSYVSLGSYPGVSAVPKFTYQRTYSYAADGRSMVVSDNNGAVVIDAQLDERGAILVEKQRFYITPETYKPVFFSTGLHDVTSTNAATSDYYEYRYEDTSGLISDVFNRSKGLIYRFSYEHK